MYNTDFLFNRAKDFQNKRKNVMDQYENRMKELERAKGSQYYNEESQKATEAKDKAIKALKAEYGDYFNTILKSMRESNSKRGLNPPTEEELRLIQLIKLKEKPTERELEAAAHTLKGNVTCLSILTEIAHKNGYARSYTHYSNNNEMAVADVDSALNAIERNLNDFMNYDTTRAARIAKNFHDTKYGVSDNTPELPKRPLFYTKEDFYSMMCGLSGDTFKAFYNAVENE